MKGKKRISRQARKALLDELERICYTLKRKKAAMKLAQ
jgi:hypothetical protein